ncbi:MAG: hypothetical protein ACR2GP_07315 [Burkholderiaceae bacterium]
MVLLDDVFCAAIHAFKCSDGLTAIETPCIIAEWRVNIHESVAGMIASSIGHKALAIRSPRVFFAGRANAAGYFAAAGTAPGRSARRIAGTVTCFTVASRCWRLATSLRDSITTARASAGEQVVTMTETIASADTSTSTAISIATKAPVGSPPRGSLRKPAR